MFHKKASSQVSAARSQYVLPGVLYFTLVAVIVSVACHTTGYQMKVNTIMLSVIGTIISFAIGLRTSSANARFDLGRTAWSGIQLASRQLAILIWIHIPDTTLYKDKVKEATPQETYPSLCNRPWLIRDVSWDSQRLELDKAKCLLEKRTMLNLVHAFAVATKHYLRGENGIYYEDLYPLCAALPKYSFPSAAHNTEADRTEILGLWRRPQRDGPPIDVPALGKSQPSNSTSIGAVADEDLEKGGVEEPFELLPAFDPPRKTIYDHVPPLVLFRPVIRFFARGDRTKKLSKEDLPASNLPLQISLWLSSYVQAIFKRGTLVGQPNSYLSPIMALHLHLTTLERVLTTPLPFAYSAHLRLSVYIYLSFLPFQTYNLLGFLSIVVSFIAALIFLGFMELGRQLEDPFGFDDTDLPLDLYCKLIGEEIAEIISHPVPDPSAFLFSPDNRPLVGDPRTAQEMYDRAKVAWLATAPAPQEVDIDAVPVEGEKPAARPMPTGPPPSWHLNRMMSSHSVPTTAGAARKVYVRQGSSSSSSS